MKAVPVVIAVFVLAVLAIVLRNWGLVTQATPVDLFVTTVDLSLAGLLLIAMIVVSLLHLVSIGRVRMQAAIESRELHRELDRARRLAAAAEDSRVAELRAYVEREVPEIEVKLDQVLERLGVQAPGTPAAEWRR